ncbi:hypothetical protein HS088_TW15G00254 [Tripterygium wilfordii]|uniref:Uncharacterized protein n=1 Tax=Tripterygium wilfordii TaxID=458696 RepID=A0A7J7CL27_TRIWF|nr:hypothetical protein HS088_TW15G00254 [Tripterygium wilfordii]
MMGRLAVTVAIFIFLFSSTTHSIDLDRIDKTEKDVIGHDLPRTFPDPETKTTRAILLPSEKPESRPATVVDWEPLSDIPESDDTAAVESSSSETETETESVPLTIISFRPINRRFRSPGRLMRPHSRAHRCRHHHQMLKPWGPFRSRVVSYGDDMLISGFKGLGPDPMFRGGVRQIPARWVREGTRFPFLRRERMRWAQPRKDEKREEENHEKEHHHHHHHEKDWFMGRIRKFLNF